MSCVPLKWSHWSILSSSLPVFFLSCLLSLLSPTSWPPSLHSFVFKLWRCCIRYTVKSNEQCERHSVHSVTFCSFIPWNSLESVSLSSLKCTAHLCLWNRERMLMRVCGCVWLDIESGSSSSQIGLNGRVIHYLCVNFYPMWSKQCWVCGGILSS